MTQVASIYMYLLQKCAAPVERSHKYGRPGKRKRPFAMLPYRCLSYILTFFFFSMNLTMIQSDMEAEERLVNDVFKPVSRLLRPAGNWSESVNIEAGLFPHYFKGLNEPMQIMDVYAWISLTWEHPKLKWEPERYDGIKFIALPATMLWLPDIGVINSAYHLYDEIFQPEKYRATVTSNGMVRLTYSGTIQTICLLDVTYFPFDEQLCHIELDSYTLPMAQARFSEKSFISHQSLRENGIWRIIGTWLTFNEDFYPADGIEMYYRPISFTFRMKRKPLFVLFNGVLPCLLLFMLELLVFCIPPEAGEKISLGITLMLSLTVFQLVMKESMPESSDFFPYLSMYLISVMMVSALTLILTVVVISLHNRTADHPMPFWVKKYFVGVLGKWLGFLKTTKPKGEFASSKPDTDIVADGTTSDGEESVRLNGEIFDPDWPLVAKILDRFCFLVMLILACVSTIGYFSVCLVGGQPRVKPLSGYGYFPTS